MTEVSQPLPSFVKMIVGGAARHILTGLAGALVTAGAIQPDQQTQFVGIAAGLVVWGAGFAWSAMQKKAAVAATTT